jgi:hypothetical protein
MNASHARMAAALVALGAILAAAPARAGDDGQASLITGLANTFGIVKQDDPHIDFRERSKIVVPPKRDLPPPSASVQDPSWPVNVETSRAKQRKHMEDAEPSARQHAVRGGSPLIPRGADVKVTTSGFDNSGPDCRVVDPKTGACPEKASGPGMNWNPLTWVGLQKKPAMTLGPEPERDNLTDPPRGYRAPSQGVGAKVEN